jgi:hypothetical protein
VLCSGPLVDAPDQQPPRFPPTIGKLQRLAPKFKSLAQSRPKSEAWEQVRKDLLSVIQQVREKKKK